MVWERNMCGFCGRVLWLVNGKLWGMASVRFCGYGVVKGGWRSRNHNMLENGFLLQPWLPSRSQNGCFRRRDNPSIDRLNVVKESCIGNGCLER
ncbi:hypothetical protein TIFTF001_037404 [Ficus carica]|uniref:Uncharacterized protein n=1 Tax=Ficus carica TaxID=3494 RepID=A0AA88E618_FICCA|nr:hypothetical protein TIFTF001_037404 [Ficus carica]